MPGACKKRRHVQHPWYTAPLEKWSSVPRLKDLFADPKMIPRRPIYETEKIYKKHLSELAEHIPGCERGFASQILKDVKSEDDQDVAFNLALASLLGGGPLAQLHAELIRAHCAADSRIVYHLKHPLKKLHRRRLAVTGDDAWELERKSKNRLKKNRRITDDSP